MRILRGFRTPPSPTHPIVASASPVFAVLGGNRYPLGSGDVFWGAPPHFTPPPPLSRPTSPPASPHPALRGAFSESFRTVYSAALHRFGGRLMDKALGGVVHAARHVCAPESRAESVSMSPLRLPKRAPKNPSKGGKLKIFIVLENQHGWSKTGFLIKFRRNGAREQPLSGWWRVPPVLRDPPHPINPRLTSPALFSSNALYSSHSFSPVHCSPAAAF